MFNSIKDICIFCDLIKWLLKLNKNYLAKYTDDRDVIEKAKGGLSIENRCYFIYYFTFFL